ncbi:AraC family transcriptional regulator [Halomonas sp. McH1-25]|uniref:AraC family transcriptional regulator n=1 Tax=unclassified Halomonas TaxID=2609666 RepID=UPI001EF5E63F|nr:MULTISPECIES: AraC family transcriptional regulator [unclassified Halomonas]MCG7602281.1 AraC family transcriptional regulator [Halomonas sp. McH1-25]MCP1344804.1 AraC family transcriptional regulator [Halomonas sp. FL8]MCP1363560.1 AraC family transcriptional regulator [Halomonas sp. BBD45]MCP1366204.1 AraC family transcriptional regulator [Halomonas sp. BBD48]
MAAENFLLEKHNILSTSSQELICEQVSHCLSPHRMRLIDNTALTSHLCSMHLEHLSIIELQYGANVEIDPGELKDVYLFRLTLDGRGDIIYNNQTVLMSQGGVTISSPEQRSLIRTSPDCHNLIVKINRQQLENYLSRLLQQNLTGPIIFDHYFPPQHPGTGFIQSTVAYFSQVSLHLRSSPEKQAQEARMEDYFYESILKLFKHNYSEHLQGLPSILPRYVKIAKQHIDSHLRSVVTLDKLASLSGVSTRSLQHGFRNFLGLSPTAYLSRQRIRSIYRILKTAPPGTRVTDIVTEFGINNLGHFSAKYKAIYGETPQQTLKSGRENINNR